MKIPSHWLIILVGLSALWLLRFLPPDASLAVIKQQGVITVCHPEHLPPYVETARSGQVTGLEPERIERLAERLGVRLSWNVQRNWYRSWDPTAWGIRKEACDLLVGGIVESQASKGLLMLSEPYLATDWAFVGPRPPQERDDVGLWAPYFGLDQTRFEATDFLDEQRLYPYFLNDLDEAVALLGSSELDAVLTDRRTAQWLAGETDLAVFPVPELPPFRFALGLWKGDVTLKREVNKVLE